MNKTYFSDNFPFIDEIKQQECEKGNYKLYYHRLPKEISGLEHDMYYVGTTRRKTLKQRWQNGCGYKTQRFGKYIDEYGWDNFEHVVVSMKLLKEDAYMFEERLISYFSSTFELGHGFNVSTGGMCGSNGVKHFGKENSFFGKKHKDESKKLIKDHHYDCSKENNSFWGKTHSLESRKKMSNSHKGKQTGKDSPKAKKVICLDNELIFETIKDACIFAKSSKVGDVCRGERHTAGGYSWAYMEI